jgi:hypothetical protein
LIALLPHPQNPASAVRRVAAEALRKAAGLAFRYRIEGRLEKLRLPSRGELPLWRHTCCEAFVGSAASPAYLELNFSPAGDWAAYAFGDYRAGSPVEVADPGIAVQHFGHGLELTAAARHAVAGPLRIALAAVIEEQDGTLSYWALRHPAGKPDFHHRDGFALELE